MKILNYLLLLATVVGLVGCSSYYTTPANSYLRVGYDLSQVDQVGMVNVVGAVQSDVVSKQIEDAFTAQILQKGYAPVVSEFLTRQLMQIQFEGSTMSPEVFAIEAGRALDYSTMLVINVPNFSDEISITAKLLDVKSGSVIWIGQNSTTRKSTSSRGGSWFKSKEDAYASEFENAMMQYNTQAYQTPQGYGGMGQMLTSEDERQVYELIASICDSLPLKPVGWQPSPYQPQIPQYSQPAPVQPTAPQVQRPAETPIQAPVFQPQPTPQPTKPRTTRKFRWRDLID
ncbi:MAG: hypothetical protein K9N55_15530 [Phycisphaerae bacterium]|nr:hypothetical protein [Phycisphaerae bacterium]